MFGLTFEKLFLVAIVAAVVIGPQRLPVYTARLAEMARALRGLVETSRSSVEAETGVSLQRADWEALDLRQYDPRRVVRDALQEPAPSAPVTATAPDVRPGQRYVVTGSAAHPRRVRIDALPVDDPRRVAAEAAPSEDH